jgi:hypothetical protein
MRGILLGLGLVALMMATVPPGTASTVDAGVSGQCYDTSGGGGQDEARVMFDSADPTGAQVIAPSGTGGAAGVAEGVMNVVSSGGSSMCPGSGYIEVDAALDGSGAQLCYAGTLITDGSCPQTPPGP